MKNDLEWRKQASAVSKRIREQRGKTGLSQQRVADQLGCWIKAYQDAEHGSEWGSRGIGARLLFEISEFFNVDIHWLWYGDDTVRQARVTKRSVRSNNFTRIRQAAEAKQGAKVKKKVSKTASTKTSEKGRRVDKK